MKAVRSLCAEVWRVFADAPVVSRAAAQATMPAPRRHTGRLDPLE
jgi:hypothetical protein